MTPVRVLAACGLASAALAAVAGFGNVPGALGASGLVMLFGNVYALLRGRRGS